LRGVVTARAVNREMKSPEALELVNSWPRLPAATPGELKQALADAPVTPGVYAFFDDAGMPIYIGKATSLRHRLTSYARLAKGPRPGDVRLVTIRLFNLSATVAWQATDSPATALIVESQLIRAIRPRLNMRLGDDRGRWYVGFSADLCPRLFVLRAAGDPDSPDHPGATYAGPFSAGADLRVALSALRRDFPFITHRGAPVRCLEFDLGLCPLPPGEDEAEWASHCRSQARRLKAVLSGANKKIAGRWRREMREAAQAGEYELAAHRRDDLQALARLIKPTTNEAGLSGARLTAES